MANHGKGLTVTTIEVTSKMSTTLAFLAMADEWLDRLDAAQERAASEARSQNDYTNRIHDIESERLSVHEQMRELTRSLCEQMNAAIQAGESKTGDDARYARHGAALRVA